MFERARRRLALRYVALFVLVLAAFSLAFIAILATVLRPAFDIAPELSSDEAARTAYAATLDRIVVALVLADGVVVALVAATAYYLAGRTLRPIQEAHDRQRRFAADASHEMRNPLAAIRASAESALSTGTSHAQRSALQTIVASSERLTALTSDLLLMARTESGTLSRTSVPVDLSLVVAEVVEQLVNEPNDHVALVLVPDLLVGADQHELTRIVSNLLDNALRYGAGRPVQLRTLEIGGDAVVEVSDQGLGIAAADLEHMFEPFYRVRSDAATPAGNGLGLTIAAELAHRCGGRISVVSQPGSGSTFRLHIPRFR